MAQSTLSIRIDDDIKKGFDKFCEEVGMNPSVAVNMFVRAVLRENRLPFEISSVANSFYSKENMARLRKSIKQMETDPKYKEFGEENTKTEVQ